MAQKLKYDRFSQFEKDIDKRDFKITSGIVEGILDAFSRNKKVAIIFEVSFDDGTDIYTLSLRKEEWFNSLKKCLPDYELKELYEKCAEIKRAMDILAEK
jgi:hypothetical protein